MDKYVDRINQKYGRLGLLAALMLLMVCYYGAAALAVYGASLIFGTAFSWNAALGVCLLMISLKLMW